MKSKPYDAVSLAIQQATYRFGGNDGTFSAAGFSECMMRIAGLNGVMDGNLVRAVLCGRGEVEMLSDGSHFRLVESYAS